MSDIFVSMLAVPAIDAIEEAVLEALNSNKLKTATAKVETALREAVDVVCSDMAEEIQNLFNDATERAARAEAGRLIFAALYGTDEAKAEEAAIVLMQAHSGIEHWAGYFVTKEHDPSLPASLVMRARLLERHGQLLVTARLRDQDQEIALLREVLAKERAHRQTQLALGGRWHDTPARDAAIHVAMIEMRRAAEGADREGPGYSFEEVRTAIERYRDLMFLPEEDVPATSKGEQEAAPE